MPDHVIVDDPGDPRLDAFRGLRGRESRDVVWVEGLTVVERALLGGVALTAVLATPAAAERLGEPLAHAGLDVLVAERDVIAAVVGFDLHRGAIAVGPRPQPRSIDEVARGAATVVVLEGVVDAENLGAIGRSALALGADALVLDRTCADPWYRRSVRVSMGALLRLPVARTGTATDALDRLAAFGFELWALTPAGAAEPITALPRPPRLALVAGAEGPGLTAAALARCRPVRIPMRADAFVDPFVDSLNVGHAVAVALASAGPAVRAEERGDDGRRDEVVGDHPRRVGGEVDAVGTQ